jgi:hypothetical protein
MVWPSKKNGKNKTRILSRELKLKCKGNRSMECPRTRWFSKVL